MPQRDSAPAGAPCWIELFTSDPEKTQLFYGELFGWTAEEAGEEYGGYVNFSKDGLMVAGCMRNDGHSGCPTLVGVPGYGRAGHRRCRGREPGSGDRPRDGRHGARHHGGGDRPGSGRDRRLAARSPQGLRHLGGAGHTHLVRAPHPRLRGLGPRSTGTCSSGTFTWRATRPSSATRRSAKAMPGWPGSWTRAPSCHEGSPASWSIYFGADDADTTLARIVDLGGSIVMPAEDTPFGRLAQAADPTGARLQARRRNVTSPRGRAAPRFRSVPWFAPRRDGRSWGR